MLLLPICCHGISPPTRTSLRFYRQRGLGTLGKRTMICITDTWDMAYEDENFERVFGRRKQVQDSLAFGKQPLEGTHNT